MRLASPAVVGGDDAELLAALRAGDEAAFAALVRRHQPSLLRLAQTMVGSRAVAEEVVQDTWVGLLRGIDRFEARSSLKTWLFRILVNRARSTGVRERRTDALADEGDRFDRSGAWSEPPEPWAEQVDDRLVAGALAERVKIHLDALPTAQRQVVLLRDVEGLPAPEVCTVLGINDGHQRVLLHRGRARLRRALENEMGSG